MLGSAWLAACAALAPYNPDRLSTQKMSRIGEICHVVMGLPTGPITQYAACVESLPHSFADRRDGGVMLAARHACEARGLSRIRSSCRNANSRPRRTCGPGPASLRAATPSCRQRRRSHISPPPMTRSTGVRRLLQAIRQPSPISAATWSLTKTSQRGSPTSFGSSVSRCMRPMMKTITAEATNPASAFAPSAPVR